MAMQLRASLSVDYEQSLFPFSDSQGKRTSERARICLPHCYVARAKTACRSLHSRINATGDFRFATLGLKCASSNNATGDFRACSLTCSFPSTSLERKETLFVVYVSICCLELMYDFNCIYISTRFSKRKSC